MDAPADRLDQSAFTLDEAEIPDPPAPYTPVPAGGTDGVGVRSLDGTWRFAPGPVDAPPGDAADWRRHEVPGQWNHAGYEVGDGERGWYRRELRVPDAWAGSRVRVRFEAVQSDCVVSVGGERVAAHEGGYTPFEVDVTEQVRPGDAVSLAVGVREHSTADEMAQWSLGGGITRGVALFAVPACHVRALDVTTTVETGRASGGRRGPAESSPPGDDPPAATGDHRPPATVTVDATVLNAGETPVDDATVGVSLDDPSGDPAGTATAALSEPLSPGEARSLTARIDLDAAATWDPERPRLHDLTVSLSSGGDRTVYEEPVGVREVDVDGSRLLLNGEPLTLRGVDYRECAPGHGQAVPPRLARRDAELFRAANVNYVRTGHHPTSTAFLEACDELGIVVEVEPPVSGVRFGRARRAEDPAFRDLLCRVVGEAVQRDRNRPSVCIWSLANESEWGPNFEAVARMVAHLDPTRPTTFNWGMYLADDEGFCDVANHHYPALRDSRVDLADLEELDRPLLFGEFAHLYSYNGEELGADPGLRDDYGRLFEAAWARVTDLDAFAGAAIWAGVDHLDPEYRWGLLDVHRRPRPEYHHVTEVYAPVQLADVAWPAGVRGDAGDGRPADTNADDARDTVAVTLENRSTFADLAEREVSWRADDAGGSREAGGTLDVSAPPGDRVTVALPDDAAAAVRDGGDLHLAVTLPAGFTIAEFALAPGETEAPAGDGRFDAPAVGRRGRHAGGEPTAAGATDDPDVAVDDPVPVAADRTDDAVTLSTPDWTLDVSRYNGEVQLDTPAGDPVLDGIPAVSVTTLEPEISSPPRYVGARGHRLRPWRCGTVDLTDDGRGVRVEGGYHYDTLDVAHGAFELRATDDGGLAVRYGFDLVEDQAARQVGLAVTAPRECDRLDWERDARWSAYPDDHVGRPSGTATPFPGGTVDDDVARLDSTRPWAADATDRGCNDFRSTKHHVTAASLTAPDGRGLAVEGDGTQHVRAAVGRGGVDLLVLDRSLAGTGLALLDRHALLGEVPTVEAGSRVECEARFRVLAAGDGGGGERRVGSGADGHVGDANGGDGAGAR
ncbi:MAG: glycoside hydrolase family 2 TIM barrel-domain containing protein [Halobacteriaceae archaeon]